MRKRALTAIAVVALLSASIGIFAYRDGNGFMMELGDSPETRGAFGSLLNEHNISYQTETDHLGRVWIVPDQSKRKEYEEVLKIWEQKRRDEVRRLNEARDYKH